MPTFNKGIRTNAGKLLAKRVEAGQTHITYTRIVFSSRDLSGSSDDDIAGMTALWPQEIAVTPETIDLNAQDPNRPDTEVRAITSNDDLNQGLTVRSYGLYAMDDDKREVLFGVAVDDEPSYLPAHQPGAQSQYLTYDWETAISDTDKVVFTNNKNVYVAYNEFDDYKKSAQSQLDSTAGSVVASASSFTSGQTAYGISTANSYTNARAGGLQYQMSNSDASLQNQINQASANATGSAASAISQADSDMTYNRDSTNASMDALPHWPDIDYTRTQATSSANSLDGKINGLAGSVDGVPHWWDENYTRSQANSYANSARDDAKGYTDKQDNSLSTRIQANTNSINANAQNITSLNGNVNSRPTWDDINYTRNVRGPELANSARDDATNNGNRAATNAFNQADANSKDRADNLQDQVTINSKLPNDLSAPNISPVTHAEQGYSGVWAYPYKVYVEQGKTYFLSALFSYVSGGSMGFINSTDANTGAGDAAFRNTSTGWVSSGHRFIAKWVATFTGFMSFNFGPNNYSVDQVCITQSDNYIPFEIAERNVLGIDFYKPNISPVTHVDNWGGGWSYPYTFHVESGKTYFLSAVFNNLNGQQGYLHSLQANGGNGNASLWNGDTPDMLLGKHLGDWTSNDGETYVARYFANKTQDISFGLGASSGVDVSNICITQSTHYVPFEIAERNRQLNELPDQVNSNSSKLNDLQNQMNGKADQNDLNVLKSTISDKIQTAGNENDAQNQSSQHPGTVFVYSD